MGDIEGGGGGKKKGGILGLPTACVACCGCATLVGVAVVVAAIAVPIYIKGMVEGAFSDEPLALEDVAYTQTDVDKLKIKLSTYANAVERGEDRKLVLDEKELNTWILSRAGAEDEGEESPFENFRLAILGDDKVRLQFSIEAPPDSPGKYFNVDFVGGVRVIESDWSFNLQSCQLGTTSVPSFLLSFLEENLQEMLFGEAQQDPDMRKVKHAVRNLAIAGGKVELELDPEIVKEMQKAVEDAETGLDASRQSFSTKDMEVYNFFNERKRFYEQQAGGYDSSKHDDVIFSEAAAKFGVSKDQARKSYRKVKMLSSTLGPD